MQAGSRSLQLFATRLRIEKVGVVCGIHDPTQFDQDVRQSKANLAIQLSYMCKACFLAVATVPIFFGELIAICSLEVEFPILACARLVAFVLPIAKHTARSCDENGTQQPESQVAVQERKESTVRVCPRDLFLHEGTIMLLEADQLAFALRERHMLQYSRMSLTSYPTQIDPYSRLP